MSKNILNTIIEHKLGEVAARKKEMSIAQLESMPLFEKTPSSLKASIQQDGKTGIIAEFKRQSPSKGVINDQANVDIVTSAYEQYGASGISVLTDQSFFGGSLADLSIAVNRSIPVLRKEFMVDEFQIIEAKAYGASAILLIAACLDVQNGIAVLNGKRNTGDFAMSCEVTLKINTLGVKLFPNPVNSVTKVKITNVPPLNETFNLSIWTTEGAMISNTKETGYNLFQGMTMDLSRLVAGSYVLKIESSNFIDAIKFIKAN